MLAKENLDFLFLSLQEGTTVTAPRFKLITSVFIKRIYTGMLFEN